jgi:hypothetical protein
MVDISFVLALKEVNGLGTSGFARRMFNDAWRSYQRMEKDRQGEKPTN